MAPEYFAGAEQRRETGASRTPWWRAILSERPADFAVAISGWCAFAMMLAITADVVGRKMGHPIPGVFDLSEQFMMLLVFLPMAAVGWRREHVIFGLTSGRIPPRMERFLDALASTLGVFLFGALGWVGWSLAWKNYLIGEYRMGDVDIVIWPFRFALAIGFLLFAIYLLALACLDFRRAVRGSGPDAPGV